MTTGRALIAIGVALAVVGVLVEFAPGLRIGRLPGDFSFGNDRARVYFPLATSIVLSILLTVVLQLFRRR